MTMKQAELLAMTRPDVDRERIDRHMERARVKDNDAQKAIFLRLSEAGEAKRLERMELKTSIY